MSGNAGMFRALVDVLEEAAVPYCILAGYDHMPEEIASDIDFMLDPECAAYLPELLQVVAARSGAHVVQCIRHETTAAYFALARQEGGALTYLHPDSSGDYRRSGRLWLRAGPVLRRRRRHPSGFWVPAAADAFAYYLIKKLDKQALSEAQGEELSRRFAEDPPGAERALKRLFFASSARAVAMAARAGDWRAIELCLPRLRAELQERAESEGWRERGRQAMADLRRLFDRLARPTGLSIAFLGADGSGKSTLIDAVSRELRQTFRQVRYRHLRPGVLVAGRGGEGGVVTDPHGKPPRSVSGSLAKLLHFWADYVVGGLLWLYPMRVRSTLVIFDRYYHDLLADPLRYRYGAPLGPARWLGRFVPAPDISFVLDAPTEVLQSRKQEVPWDECERQRHAYIATARGLPGAHVIDASRPVDEVVARVLERVLAHMEARTARRLALYG
jgi:thymidylate kinase